MSSLAEVPDGIVVDGVSRSFGAVHAVRSATFHAASGRVTGLVGPNGAGKTTLLLMLASLLAPDSGSIRLDGVDPVTNPLAARRLLGWMPDALGAWPSMTARETLVTTGRLHDIPHAEAASRAEQLLTLVDLAAFADAPARVLSRGQKQKLGLARALVHGPRILLLDEPASGLDPGARVQLRILLRRLAAEGCTVLISSHVLAELEEVVDDAVFLVAGSVAQNPDRTPSARSWRIRVAEPAGEPGAIAAALGLEPEVVGQDRSDVLVAFESEDAAASALRRLVEAGLAVSEFAPAQSSLEHAFLRLGPGGAQHVSGSPNVSGSSHGQEQA